MAAWDITAAGAALEFNPAFGVTPSNVIELDSTHYMVAYNGESLDGYLNILTLDRGTWTLTSTTQFEFDITQGKWPFLYKISDTQVLCAYGQLSDDGFIVVLTINPSDWSVTAGTPLEFDTVDSDGMFIDQIDATHYLVSWGTNTSIKSQVFVVSGTTVSTAGSALTLSTNGYGVATEKVDTNHVLVTWTENHELKMRVVEVNTGTWEPTAVGTAFGDVVQSINKYGAKVVKKLTSTVYVIAYYNIFAASIQSFTLEVDGSYNITKLGEVLTVAASTSDMGLLMGTLVGENHLVVTQKDGSGDGWFWVLEIDTVTGAVTTVGTPLEFEPVDFAIGGMLGTTLSGTTDKFIMAWQGPDSDGFAQVFSVELPPPPVDPEPSIPLNRSTMTLEALGNFVYPAEKI